MIVTRDVKVKSLPKRTTVYNKFRGVDFSTDPSLVDAYRSPYALNIISDMAGMPEKRLGWRCIHNMAEAGGGVNGLYYGDIGGEGGKMLLAHIGTKLYEFSDSFINEIYSGLANKKSCGFFMKDETVSKFYILSGGQYLCYDGNTVADVLADGYTPTVLISKNPDGTGGTVFESVNLLSGKRCESFLGNSTDTVYRLAVKDVASIDKVEVRDANGEFQEITTGFTPNLADGTVTFDSAKPPVVAGQDNVKITYTKEVAGYKSRILNCTIAVKYGYGGSNRVFLSGNPDYKAYDWYSDIHRPDYFPDTGFSVVGDDNTAIMGYQKVGKYLVIVKESNNQDSTVFQRWGGLNEKGEVEFYIEQGVAGVGAIAPGSFSTLIDEPLFLSERGVFAITTTNILAERTLRNRSYFVDNYLLKEEGLKNAVSCEWNGYYILCINNKCYVLDSKNKSYKKNRSYEGTDFIYEAYYWDNIPAVSFLSVGGELFFGTADGRICKFNTDKTKLDKYSDDGFRDGEGGEGQPVVALWSTLNDDDGASYLYKSMQKKGCSVTIKPFYRSSAKIYVIKDGNGKTFLKASTMDILRFFDLDFERFTFNTNTSPQDIYLKKKIKKYKRLQFIVTNDALNEGFGIYQIAKTFTMGNYAKK